MARGSQAKEAITQKLLSTFEGSFAYDKEIRIPFNENGEEVQIKVTLTCAKENVSAGNDKATPMAGTPTQSTTRLEITPEEAENVRSIIDKLGL